MLTLVRHAKSSWDDSAVKDFDRPLNERGREQCEPMGELLQKTAIEPDLILCSTAKRARQTLNRLLKNWQTKAEIVFEGRLYLATSDRLLALLGKLGKNHKHIMLIGHNPGLHLLAFNLADRGEPAMLKTLAEKFPTLGMCSIKFESDAWKTLGNGELAFFATPKTATDIAPKAP